jgi:[ribosomal protein S5]-alanine N-acetyltransferase
MLNLDLSTHPVLTTDRLTLRRADEHDAPELFFLRSDEETMKYINRVRAKTIDDALKLIAMTNEATERGEGIHWAITKRNEQKLIGHIALFKINKENHRAEVGYILHPAYHRQGIMHETLSAVLPFGFNTIGLHSIEARVNPHNMASIQLLEKCGFIREAYFREDFFWEGNYLDSAVYSLLAPKE